MTEPIDYRAEVLKVWPDASYDPKLGRIINGAGDYDASGLNEDEAWRAEYARFNP